MGAALEEAIGVATALCAPPLGELLRRALELAAAGAPAPGVLRAELGEGWTGDEALAIALACAAGATTPLTGLQAAVLHSGDTASTGAICGQLLGACHGLDAFPVGWLGEFDGADVVTSMADDCGRWLVWQARGADLGELDPRWLSRYGWRS